MGEVILEVKNLKKYYNTPKGSLAAVDDVSFTLEKGKILGVVGESGCGKSTIGRTIVRLIEPTSGEVLFEGKNIFDLKSKEMKELRKDLQIIFQDPYSALDPRMSVHQLIEEPLLQSKEYKTKKEREERVLELMEMVGLAKRLYNAFPHELDGGRRQRIGIARALANNPKLIVCDEPVSALDVSIQAQILNILKELQEKFGFTYIFVTHDLSVVYYFSDEIAVMYLGKMVEKASAEELFANPLHPYTQALLSAIPSTDIDHKGDRILLKGEVSSPINLPNECRFAKRCNHCHEDCTKRPYPDLVEVRPNHFVACHYPLIKTED
ncbi:MAG: ABC transporter ATP-binding protein [Ruminococcaceae bacterium]|nr:ABC transporter ATP-binding protein [Oscillospiraceae bacterium]